MTILRGCPYSRDAVAEVRKLSRKRNDVKIEKEVVLPKHKDAYKEKHNIQTFPQIWVKKTDKSRKQHIGGYDDLIPYLQKL